MALTDRRIKRLVAAGEPGRFADHGGLHFRIAPGGSTSWVLRARIDGRRVERGLGGYPAVALVDARLAAQVAYVDMRQNGLEAVKRRSPLTLREAAARAHRDFKPDWRRDYAARWLKGLQVYVLEDLGSVPVAEVTQEQVKAVLRPLYQRVPVTAKIIRNNLRRVFAWAQSEGLRPDNPAGEVLDGGLPRKSPVPQHHRAPHYSDVAASIARVRSGAANPMTRLLFEYIAHSASRTGEARLMRWEELNGDWTVWTIPAERAKTHREARKPVTRQMASIIRTAQALQELLGTPSGHVFATGKGPLSSNALQMLMKRYGIRHTLHGLRSSFRTWGAEHGERWDLLETQLSHSLGSAIAQAYIRTDLLQERAEVMQRWSDYLDAEDYWQAGLALLITLEDERE